MRKYLASGEMLPSFVFVEGLQKHLPKGWKLEVLPQKIEPCFSLLKDGIHVAHIAAHPFTSVFVLKECVYPETKGAVVKVIKHLNESLKAENQRQEGIYREKVLLAVLGEVPPESADPATKDDPSEASADVEKKSSRFWPFVWLANAVVFLTILFVVSNWVF